jgi:hypothetical protein
LEFIVLPLRVVHIFGAVFWVGAAWLSAFFLVPTVRALGPDASKFMGHLIGVRKLSMYISIAGGLTIVAGWLLWLMRYSIPSLSTGAGMTFLIGGIIGTIALVVGSMVGGISKRIGALGAEIAQQGKPPTPEQGAQMGALQARMASVGLWAAILTAIALFLMSIARSLWF